MLLTKFDTSRESEAEEVTDKERTSLGPGLTEGKVETIKLRVKTPTNERLIPFAIKEFYEEPDLKGILENYKVLLARGIPTIPTVRYNPSEKKTLYMTDLSQNGKNEVVSLPDFWRTDERSGKFYSPDKNHSEVGYKQILDVKNSTELYQQIIELYEKCNATGIYVGHVDAFFIIRDKETGYCTVILGDLSGIRESKISKNLVERNSETFSYFLEQIPKVAKVSWVDPMLRFDEVMHAEYQKVEGMDI